MTFELLLPWSPVWKPDCNLQVVRTEWALRKQELRVNCFTENLICEGKKRDKAEASHGVEGKAEARGVVSKSERMERVRTLRRWVG